MSEQVKPGATPDLELVGIGLAVVEPNLELLALLALLGRRG